jgi:hypothetical protein
MDERQKAIAELEARIAAKEAALNNVGPTREEQIAQLEAQIAAKEAALASSLDEGTIADESPMNFRRPIRYARAGLSNLAGLADVPNIAATGLYLAGLKETPTFYDPISEKAEGLFDTVTGDNYKPQNKFEEYEDIAAGSLAPMLLAPFTGGASLLATAAKSAAKLATKATAKKALDTVAKFGSKTYAPTKFNVASSVGGSTAAKTYAENAEDPGVLGTLGAGLLGGLGGASAANYKNIAAKGMGKATRFNPKEYAKYKDLNVRMSLGDTGKGTVPKKIEYAAAHTLGLENQFKKHYLGQESDLARNIGITNHKDLEGAVSNIPHELAKKGATGYEDRFKDITDKKFSKFKRIEDEAIAKGQQVDVSDMIGELEAKRNRALTEHTKELFDATRQGKLLKDLKGAIPSGNDLKNGSSLDPAVIEAAVGKQKTINEINKMPIPENMKKQMLDKYEAKTKDIKPLEYEPKGTGVGYEDLNDMRETALHESIDARDPFKRSTPKSRAAAEVSHKLSERRHKFVEEHGTPTEKRHSKEGKAMYSAFEAPPHMKEDTGVAHFMRKITGSENDQVAFNKLKKDSRYLKVARQGLSKAERPQLAEALVADSGNTGGRFSVNKAHSTITAMPKKVQKELVKTVGDKTAQKTFNDTMKLIGKNKRMMKSIENTSGTTQAKQTINIISKVAQTGVYAATGYFAPFVKMAVGAAIVKGGAKLWTNQDFLHRVNKTMTATSTEQLLAAAKALSRSVNQAGRQSEHVKSKKDLRWEENGKPHR